MKTEAQGGGISASPAKELLEPAAASTQAAYRVEVPDAALSIEGLSVYYGEKLAVENVSLQIPRNQVTAFIGPSGCGKSTLLRALNRMNDLVDGIRTEGRIMMEGRDVTRLEEDLTNLRRRIGMVFQAPNPFPKTIFENVVYGLRIAGERNREKLFQEAERSLRAAALWEEVHDRLHESALGLSGGQMQRLCIARAIAVNPGVILMDEPCSALDPIATTRIEDLIHDLRKHFTVVIVTHNMQQAARVSDYTAFLYLGRLIEYNHTKTIFTQPRHQETQDYITGRFG